MAIHFTNLLQYYLTSTTTNDTTTTTTSTTTATIPCTELCDPSSSCGDLNECYNLPSEPDPVPLPPPLPPTTIVATPSPSTHGAFHISPLVIVIIVVLASAFVLVSYYAIIIKYCSFLTRIFTRRDLTRTPQPNHHLDNLDDHDAMMNQFSPVVDHPIWLISTVGLHQSIINSITVIPYKKDDGLIDGTDCSVCLSEFQEEETLRLLPKCKHAFHIDCIDTWLRSHTNCPMCRAAIVANSGRPSMASNEPSFGHSRRTEFPPLADSDSSDVELGNNNPQVGNTVSLVVENRGGGETGEFEAENDHNKVDNFVTPIALFVRRSYSMDYRNAAANFLQPNNPNSDSNPNSNSFAGMGSSSSRPMKRSYSWSERVFWSTLNQSNRNSVMSP